ncbi:MAG: phenylalanine--tRNA ligase subunit beta, partial [Gammaproteobacteria bacterium]|nr:phenylalanine--tRNA ligase subunit beta [Gammaproteobacteria bacterium]
MKISEHWLREWVAFDDDANALAHRLTMAGLEVDSITPAAPEFSDVVVAEVVACEPHPNADRLRVCQVNDGSDTLKSVVCGAPNAAVGLKAPFAQIGAVLPGDFKIKAAKLRGVASEGMLCSGRELGVNDEAAGLWALPEDAPVGRSLRDWLGLDDTIIEVELTPNRSDCLGMAGIAREVAALTQGSLSPAPVKEVPPTITDQLNIDLEAHEDCPRYCGRIIKGVNTRAATPIWMQERLRRAGLRPLSLAVDVTNYVMLELGQPLHAFDLHKIDQSIRVRRAKDGEQLKLLNGDTVTLSSNTLLIADQSRPLALAGVMGGSDSAVGDETVDLFLESAFFAPRAIAGRARQYNLHTDASHRYERGVEPALCRVAIERATQLLIDLGGGQPGPVVDEQAAAALPAPVHVTFRPQRVNELLGSQIDDGQIEQILTRLGLEVDSSQAVWQVKIPGWRFDISREVDLIEEVARVYGYDQLPIRHASAPASIPAHSERQVTRERQRLLLVDRGYHEVISYSFVAESLQQQLDPDQVPLALANPLSSDLTVMRSSLWPGLVTAAVHNQNRQMRSLKIFETGLRFRGQLETLQQQPTIAGLAAGAAVEDDWSAAARPLDFFDVKGDVEALLTVAQPSSSIQFEAQQHPALHPGQSAAIRWNEQTIGWVGALHPGVLRNLDLIGPVFVFEVEQSVFGHRPLPSFSALSRYPAIRRDLAVVVDESITAQVVMDSIRHSAGPALQSVMTFDVYRGDRLGAGKKSLALGL